MIVQVSTLNSNLSWSKPWKGVNHNWISLQWCQEGFLLSNKGADPGIWKIMTRVLGISKGNLEIFILISDMVLKKSLYL